MNRRMISQVLAWIVLIFSIAVMFGWVLNFPVLKSIFPNWAPMKFITAVSFLFSSILIMLLAKKEKSESSKIYILIISYPYL